MPRQANNANEANSHRQEAKHQILTITTNQTLRPTCASWVTCALCFFHFFSVFSYGEASSVNRPCWPHTHTCVSRQDRTLVHGATSELPECIKDPIRWRPECPMKILRMWIKFFFKIKKKKKKNYGHTTPHEWSVHIVIVHLVFESVGYKRTNFFSDF